MSNRYISKGYYWDNINACPKFENVEIDAKNGDVLIKVKASMFGKALYRAVVGEHAKLTPPLFLGSLISGEILEDNDKNKKGMRVVVNPHAPCTTCELCRNGMSEQCKNKVELIPGGISTIVCVRKNVDKAIFEIPDNVTFEKAVYAELVACALEALEKARLYSKNLMIIGCGLMGLIMTKTARFMGFEKVFCLYNKNDNRKKIIEEAGAVPLWFSNNNTDDLIKILKLAVEQDTFSIIEAVGSTECFELSLKLAKPKSAIILFGGYNKSRSKVYLDLNMLHYNNLIIQGTYHFAPDKFEKAIELLADDGFYIDDLITQKIQMSNIDHVYVEMRKSDNISNIIVFE